GAARLACRVRRNGLGDLRGRRAARGVLSALHPRRGRSVASREFPFRRPARDAVQRPRRLGARGGGSAPGRSRVPGGGGPELARGGTTATRRRLVSGLLSQ